jgi:hypothetical protein
MIAKAVVASSTYFLASLALASAVVDSDYYIHDFASTPMCVEGKAQSPINLLADIVAPVPPK